MRVLFHPTHKRSVCYFLLHSPAALLSLLTPLDAILPSESSRSSSASWSLTSLGRADRSTPRSAMVGSAAACGTFEITRMAAGTVQHVDEKQTKNQGVVVVFTPSSRLPDTAITVGAGISSPEESVSHMTRLMVLAGTSCGDKADICSLCWCVRGVVSPSSTHSPEPPTWSKPRSHLFVRQLQKLILYV